MGSRGGTRMIMEVGQISEKLGELLFMSIYTNISIFKLQSGHAGQTGQRLLNTNPK